MKNLKALIGLIAALGLISYHAMAQKVNDQIPQAVQSAFSTKYPQANLKNWKIKKDSCIASFIMDKRRYEASYSKNGNWLRVERNMRRTSSLPAEALLYLKKAIYASWHVDELEKVQTPSESLYLVQVDNNSGNQTAYENAGSVENKMLYFDESGKLIRVIEL
jgi:hypothetical protein